MFDSHRALLARYIGPLLVIVVFIIIIIIG